MQSLRAGNRASLETLFERHHRPMYGFFRGQLGREDRAEDLVQELFLRILRYRKSYREGARFLPWMVQIARNLARDEFEPADLIPLEAAGELEHRSTPETDLLRNERQERVMRALAELPIETRELVLLSHVKELRYREIGEILGIQEGAVKVRVHRAIERLRELVAAQETKGVDEP